MEFIKKYILPNLLIVVRGAPIVGMFLLLWFASKAIESFINTGVEIPGITQMFYNLALATSFITLPIWQLPIIVFCFVVAFLICIIWYLLQRFFPSKWFLLASWILFILFIIPVILPFFRLAKVAQRM